LQVPYWLLAEGGSGRGLTIDFSPGQELGGHLEKLDLGRELIVVLMLTTALS
jgi:hypothetical protein